MIIEGLDWEYYFWITWAVMFGVYAGYNLRKYFEKKEAGK